MQVTYLVGNGFDIHFGLKTQYSDFYQSLNLPAKVTRNNIYKSINEKPKEWSDFELQLGEYTKELKTESDNQTFQNDLTAVYTDLIKYLTDCSTKIDFSKTTSSNVGQIFQRLISDLASNDANKVMGLNQKLFQDSINYNFLSFNYTDTLDKYISKYDNNSKVKLKLINKIYPVSLQRCLHIHGTLKNGVLLGVNDVSQLNNTLFGPEEFERYIKPKALKAQRDGMPESAMTVINTSNVICIYGMSFGETDTFWWNLICDWLAKNADHLLVICNYFTNDSLSSSLMKINHRRTSENQILKYLNSKEKRPNLSEQILVCENNGVYTFWYW